MGRSHESQIFFTIRAGSGGGDAIICHFAGFSVRQDDADELKPANTPEGRQHVQEEDNEKQCTESFAYGGGCNSSVGTRPNTNARPANTDRSLTKQKITE